MRKDPNQGMGAGKTTGRGVPSLSGKVAELDQSGASSVLGKCVRSETRQVINWNDPSDDEVYHDRIIRYGRFAGSNSHLILIATARNANLAHYVCTLEVQTPGEDRKTLLSRTIPKNDPFVQDPPIHYLTQFLQKVNKIYPQGGDL